MRLTRLVRSACAAVALSTLAAFGAGCAATRVPTWCAGAPAPAKRWTLVVPAGAAGGDAVRALVARRRLEYAVEVVEYDPKAGTPETRLAGVRAALQRNEGGRHPSGPTEHVLLVGSPGVLSMGPWNFEGAGEPIATDWPLTSTAVPDGLTFARGAWEQELAAAPLRTVGRIPLDDPADIERAMAATLRADDAAAAPAASAVMGTTVFGGGWPLAAARDDLRARGWDATVCGDRLSCDAPAGAFAPARARDPKLVVIVGGAAPLMGRASDPDREPRAARGGGTIAMAFASDGLALGVGERPDPALAGATAIAGFTGGIEAAPLGPSMYAISHLPVELADGVPLGLAVERVRHTYWASASEDIGCVFPGVAQAAARNTLAAIVVGDPALCAVKHPLPVAGSPESRPAEDLPVVVAPTPAAGANAADAANGGPGNAPAANPRPSWMFPLLLGLFAALVALLYAATKRRAGTRRAPRR